MNGGEGSQGGSQAMSPGVRLMGPGREVRGLC